MRKCLAVLLIAFAATTCITADAHAYPAKAKLSISKQQIDSNTFDIFGRLKSKEAACKATRSVSLYGDHGDSISLVGTATSDAEGRMQFRIDIARTGVAYFFLDAFQTAECQQRVSKLIKIVTG